MRDGDIVPTLTAVEDFDNVYLLVSSYLLLAGNSSASSNSSSISRGVRFGSPPIFD